jgi:glycine oxidase
VPAILWGPDCYIVPRTDGTLLVGATVEEVGFDERTTAEGIAGLLDAARSLLPRLSADSVIEARAGLRPATPDNLPVIGRDPAVPAVIHASGHYRNGVLLAPITAKAVADLVVRGETAVDLSPFRPERFL